jgi:molecular chaperone DnaJ
VARERFEFRSSPAERGQSAAATLSGCFEDEIAIDFPAVDELVLRIRDRFLGQRQDVGTLTLRLCLSPREAARGAIVPIEVPLLSTCDPCGGRGETWAEVCAACQGSGHALVRRAVRLSVPPGVVDGTRLRLRVSSPLAMPVIVEVVVAIGYSHA